MVPLPQYPFVLFIRISNALFRSFKKNMCMIAGKVMMDRNAPKNLLDTPQSSYEDSQALISKWHKK